MHGSIDAFHQMSKAKEGDSLAARLHQYEGPVRLLVGTVPHPAEVPHDQRDLLRARLADFRSDSVTGSGQYIHEEQPEVVVAAVAGLDEAARYAGAGLSRRRLPHGAGGGIQRGDTVGLHQPVASPGSRAVPRLRECRLPEDPSRRRQPVRPVREVRSRLAAVAPPEWPLPTGGRACTLLAARTDVIRMGLALAPAPFL